MEQIDPAAVDRTLRDKSQDVVLLRNHDSLFPLARRSARSRRMTAQECWDAAEKFGFPLIIKPVAGARLVRLPVADSTPPVISGVTHSGVTATGGVGMARACAWFDWICNLSGSPGGCDPLRAA